MAEQQPNTPNIGVGLAAALVLTVIPFAVVAGRIVSGDAAIAVIAVAAALQVLVHLRFFLGLGFSRTPQETLLAIGFASVLIAIMLGGSLWIMSDLHTRMMP